jgi:hypothetical protein
MVGSQESGQRNWVAGTKKRHHTPSFYLFIFGKYQTDSWLKVASEERE